MGMRAQLLQESGWVDAAEKESVDPSAVGEVESAETVENADCHLYTDAEVDDGAGRRGAGCEPDGLGADGSGTGQESDESVLRRLNAGEQMAMGELWKRYAGLLFSQALRVLHNPSEAEDVVAEVFSEVWRRSGGYHPERARPAAWLVTLVRRRAIDRFRERRSLERAEERMALENGKGPAVSNGVEEQVRISELRRLLEQALNRLPERQREAVCMVYFDGLTQREISKRTRTPIGTIKTRLELGLRKMRERIRGVRPVCDGGVGAVEARICGSVDA
jgi:RNA polymerase sigma-70 factor (ECF subfamily)